MSNFPPPARCTTVFFDGSCPLCRREIGLYRRLVPTTPIAWVDVSTGDAAPVAGRSCGELMARFHVRTADGRMLSGAAAFVALWLLFPGWRWLGKLGSLPAMPFLLERLYRGFLYVRPVIQWLFKKFTNDKQ
ncbi:thiol-disulfide oxidoreductase DCC family protein [Massilia sp. PWRC2]|uniref:thiol-disulfide oxidoreductase DCC family protein n=1 Tax=Massilia sp. PWRC2 TaxID=2804626 RepID=UPI003CEF2580